MVMHTFSSLVSGNRWNTKSPGAEAVECCGGQNPLRNECWQHERVVGGQGHATMARRHERLGYRSRLLVDWKSIGGHDAQGGPRTHDIEGRHFWEHTYSAIGQHRTDRCVHR